MKAVSFVARSGTGKTTLITRVIPELVRRGYRVGALKHDAHRFDIDHPGKDSHRLTAAGAEVMVIASAGKLAMVRKMSGPPAAEELVGRYFAEMDVVLLEGFGGGPYPVIEVRREGQGAKEGGPGSALWPRVVAVASDEPLDLPVPVLDLNDPVAVAAFIEERFLK
jgi:molybdopterin-guanine dinucleotide biosynthesis protein MobB